MWNCQRRFLETVQWVAVKRLATPLEPAAGAQGEGVPSVSAPSKVLVLVPTHLPYPPLTQDQGPTEESRFEDDKTASQNHDRERSTTSSTTHSA